MCVCVRVCVCVCVCPFSFGCSGEAHTSNEVGFVWFHLQECCFLVPNRHDYLDLGGRGGYSSKVVFNIMLPASNCMGVDYQYISPVCVSVCVCGDGPYCMLVVISVFCLKSQPHRTCRLRRMCATCRATAEQ